MTSSTSDATLGFMFLMAVMMSTTAISIDAILPALSHIGDDLVSTSANQVQYIIGIFLIGLAIGQLVAGPLSDAIGRKKLLYYSLVVYIAGALICYFAQDMTAIFIGRAVQGLGASGPIVTCMAVVRDRFEGSAMARVMSFVMMIFITAPVIAPALGQFIMLFVSWRAIFVFYMLYVIVIGICVRFFLDETLKLEDRREFSLASLVQGLKVVVGHKPTLLYTLAMGCVFAGFIGYLTSIQQIFQEQFKVGEMFVVWFGIQALGFGLSSLINSKIVEKLGMSYIVSRALIVLIILGGGMALLSAQTTISFFSFFFFGMFSLFVVGLLFGNLNALAMEAMGELAGTATAIISAISNLVSLSIGMMIGQQYDGTLLPLSFGFSIMGMVAWLLLYFADKAKMAQV